MADRTGTSSRIVDLKLDVVTVERDTGFRSQHALVQLRSSDDVVGVGEMSDLTHLPKYAIDVSDLHDTLAELVLGRQVADIATTNAAVLDVFPQTDFYYDKSAPIRCGVDIALHDLLARTLGISVATLLGGSQRDRIKTCYPIFRSTTLDQVSTNLDNVSRRVSEGFDAFRVYVGSNADADEALLDGIRSRFGDDVTVKSLDFSHLLDPKSALRQTKRLLPYAPLLVESPAPQNDFEGLRWFRSAVDIPVSEHVWSFRQMRGLVMHDSVDVFNVCLTFIGGFAAASAVSAAARIAGKPCLIGTTQELGIGTAAQAAFGSTLFDLWPISDPTGPCLYEKDVVASPPLYEDGFLLVPSSTAPGLGVTIDDDLLADIRTESFSWGRELGAELRDRTAPPPGMRPSTQEPPTAEA